MNRKITVVALAALTLLGFAIGRDSKHDANGCISSSRSLLP
jgi:hypothetical protein